MPELPPFEVPETVIRGGSGEGVLGGVSGGVLGPLYRGCPSDEDEDEVLDFLLCSGDFLV